MQKTNIPWTEYTWNPGCGCPLPLVSDGCQQCWARSLHNQRHKALLAGKKLPEQYRKPFEEIQLFPDRLEEPLHKRKPCKIAVCLMGDLFAYPFEFIDKVMAVVALCPQHTFQCLSKRPEIMQNYFKKALPRVSALVYNEKYGQRKSIFRDDTSGRIRDRFAGQNMANNETPREGCKAGRRVLSGSNHKSLQESKGRILNDKRVSLHNSNPQRSTDCHRSAQGGLGLQQQANPKGNDHQPRKWNKGRQLSRESNPNDIQPTEVSCLGSIESESPQTTGKQAPKDISNRKASVGHPKTSQSRNDGERHSTQIQDEAKSNICNLQSSDVEACLNWPLPNLHLGVTVENQKMLYRYYENTKPSYERFCGIPAAKLFVSFEPLLTSIISHFEKTLYRKPDLAIIGAESKGSHPGRECKIEWVRDLVHQCQAAGVKVFVKQLHINGKLVKRIKDFPKDLQIRQDI